MFFERLCLTLTLPHRDLKIYYVILKGLGWILLFFVLTRIVIGHDVGNASFQHVIWNSLDIKSKTFPANLNLYLFKVDRTNTWKRCEMCSKLAITTPGWSQRRCTGVFMVDFEQISHPFLQFLLLVLSMYLFARLHSFL